MSKQNRKMIGGAIGGPQDNKRAGNRRSFVPQSEIPR
jgi:hypothetical protein